MNIHDCPDPQSAVQIQQLFNYRRQPSATVLRHVEIQESRDLGTDRS